MQNPENYLPGVLDNYPEMFNRTNVNISAYNFSNYSYDGYNYDQFEDYTFTYPPDHPICQNNGSAIRENFPSYNLCIHILLPVLCSIGILGILLTVVVLSRKSMSTSTNSYLISLAMADLFFLVIMLMRVMDTRLDREAHYWFLIVLTYSSSLLNLFLFASVWLTVMLAVERYIAICHPLRAMSICTVIRARIIIVVIFAVALVYHIPEVVKFKITYFLDYCLGKEVPMTTPTAFAMNMIFRKVYNWVTCFFLAVLPFCLLLVLNGCLIREIHRSTNYLRYHLASDSNVQTIITGEEIRITLMLISVVVVFFVCQAPYIIHQVVASIYPDVLLKHLNILTYVTILLLVTRSSLNFIMYCWFSEKFWNTFKRTFCKPSCLLMRAPTWIRSRVWNHSEHGHSNNNRVVGHGDNRTTSTHYENGLLLRSLCDHHTNHIDHVVTNV
ncbi:FMRFamide receptor-like isoform X2 [Mya arenaria]|uniref:FMRFamide receptor-like isoform X2 n=1 Tax=Mya arenaria TaxID=6604 RepID=UPI0022E5FDB3|nr:FMRFamide receptor-like isoform X2 [Mya arenaria]